MKKFKPSKIEKATDQELAELRHKGRQFKWELPPETFNGETWKLSVPNDQTNSLANSFRNQAQSIYGKRAKVRRANGYLFVRLTDEKVSKSKRKS